MTGPTPFDDTLTGTSGVDIIDGLAGNDTIEGFAGADRLLGGLGNDTLSGGTGNDTLNGGDGSDTYVVAQGDGIDFITDSGATGSDTIVAADNDVAITLRTGFSAVNGIETISAGGFTNVTIQGTTAADSWNFSTVSLVGIASIDGGAGNDLITGSAGADTIIGGAGNDTLNGGAGSDTYVFAQGDGFDAITDSGASGTDSMLAAADDVAITLRSGFSAASGIEVVGADSHSNVTIRGGTAADILNFTGVSLVGIVSIDGDAGLDTITGSTGNDTITGGLGNDRLTGNSGDDAIFGNEDADTIAGGLGNDVLSGGAGNDTLDGGQDSDTYLVGQSEGFDAITDTGTSGTDTILATDDEVVIGIRGNFSSVNRIESINADGHSNITILGTAGADTLNFSATSLIGIASIGGGEGSDVITGSAAADTIIGGAGNDTLNGGGDSDTYVVGQGDGEDLISDTGASGTDTILAAGDDVTITLRTGFSAANGIEVISAGGHTGIAIVGTTAGDILNFSTTSLVDIVRIDGAAGNDTITGSAAADTISGGTGNDTLNGGGGSDTYIVAQGDGLDTFSDTGPSGSDTILAADDNVAITLRTGFAATTGIETISAGGHANVTILGSAAADTYNFSGVSLDGLTGIDAGAGNDIVTGSAWADTIIGGAGNDTLNGGDGSDSYVFAQGDGLDTFSDTGASGADAILAADDNVAITLRTGFSAATGIEAISSDGHLNVTILGSAAVDTLNLSGVSLIGIAAIDGAAGNDAITGSAGDDTIVGGAGNDTLNAGEGSDTYLFAQGDGLDTIADTGTAGIDTIAAAGDNVQITLRTGFSAVSSGIEAISDGGNANVTIVGSGFSDTYNFSGMVLSGIDAIDAGAGNDTITGSAGDDTILGGAGVDALNGGGGSDTYVVSQGDGIDNIADTGASGSDSIVASGDDVAITLRSGFSAASSGVETISSGGFANVTILGGTSADTYNFAGISLSDIAAIDGGAGSDLITGSAGDDTIIGGVGADTMNGADGSDTYVVSQGDGIDIVTDTGASGTDTILAAGDGVAITLRTGFSAASSGVETISSGGNVNVTILGSSAAENYNFSGVSLSGIAFIDGGAGGDAITGSAGADTIFGGSANDTLNGGDGSDTYIFAQGDGLDAMTDTGATGVDTILAAADDVAITLRNGFGAGNGIESISAGGFNNVTIQGATTGDVYNFTTIALTDIALIDGGAGNDTITGSAGADIIAGGDGNDILAGGAGNDMLSYASAGAAVVVNLSLTVNQNTGGAGLDRVSGFENVTGSAFADTLTGDAAANVIVGGAGDDQMTGGAGADNFAFTSLGDLSSAGDTITDFASVSDQIDLSSIPGLAFIGTNAFSNVSGQVRYELSAGTTRIQIDSDGDGVADRAITIANGQFTLAETTAGSMILISLSAINGTANNDNLIGTNNADVISALGGNDFVQGRGGNDIIFGGEGNDTLNGDGQTNYTGPSGDDTLFGEGGDDLLRGGAGVDTYDGGAGNDRISFYIFASTQGVIANLTTQTIANDGFGNAETMTSIEGLGAGTAFADHFTGDENANQLLAANGDTVIALGGDDVIQLDGAPVTLDGGEGNDSISVFTLSRLVPDTTGDGLADLETGTQGVIVDLSLGQIINDGFGLSGTLISIENVGGSGLADTLTGDAGDNRLTGGGGNDSLAGGGGADRLIGGLNDDTMTGGAGADVYVFETVADLSTTGDQIADYELGADTLDFSAIAGLTFIGTAAFSNAAGQMRYERSGGQTVILIDANGDGVADGRVVIANVEAILMETAPGSKILRSAADVVGTPNDDPLNGTADGERIFGLAGNDTIIAGNGDDIVTGGAGNDTMDGGEGTDVLSYAGDTFRTEGVSVDLRNGTARNFSNTEVDTVVGFEIVEGTAFGDNLFASNFGVNTLRGLNGNDSLFSGNGPTPLMFFDGGDGVDRVSFERLTTTGLPVGITVDLRIQGVAQFIGPMVPTVVTLTNIESVTGSGSNDTLTGNEVTNFISGFNGDDVIDGQGGDDNLFGDSGNDLMTGGQGNDFFRAGAGNDTMDGGVGNDRVSLFGATSGGTIDLNIQGVAQDTLSQGMDTLISIEDASGSVHNDTLIGNTGDNWLWGNWGIDTLTGGDGNDLFYGDGGTGAGMFSDIVSGGTGIDTMSYYEFGVRTNGVTVDLAAGTGGDVAASECDSLSGIENVDGTQFADVISGDGNANVLAGLQGDDTLAGRGGADVYAFRSLDDLSGIGDQITDYELGADTLDFSTIPGLTFIGTAAFSNVAGQMRYERSAGQTTILIDANGDGVADDRVLITNVDAILVETAPGSNILRSAADIVGTANSEVLNGTADGERIFALGGNDTVNAGDGNDVVDGGAGVDILNGGEGDDTIVISDLGFSDQVNGGNGYDTLDVRTLTGTNWNFTWTGMERFLGSEFQDRVFAADLEVLDQALFGNGGDDLLRGGGGNDIMDGGAGNDQFRGGTGVDVFIGGDGDDRISFFENRATQAVVANLTTQTISNDGFGNAETMTSIEGLGAGTAFADTFIGNNNANFLLGNTGDTITALEGDDTFQLEGAPGIIDGGAGNDTIAVFTGSRLIADFTGDGVADAVNATSGVTVDLPLGQIVNDGFGLSGALLSVENVNGSGLADTLTGDAADNRLGGLAQNDILVGGGGNDILTGGLNDDTMTGGVGADVYVFGTLDDLTATGDTITDFERGVDTLDFSAIAGLTFIGTAAFSNVAGQMRYETGGGTTTILIDANGDGVADDRVVISNVEVVLAETAPGSKLLFSAADIVGTPNGETLNGTIFGERIFGLGGDDTINALDQNDWADGGEGNDVVNGNDGNDTIAGGAGNDTLDGGAGIDTLTYANDAFRTQGVYADLGGNTANDLSFVEIDILSNFENIDGTSFYDELYGSSGDNVLRGLDGNDSILGGLGNDTVDGGAGIDTAMYNFANTGGVTVDLRIAGAQNTVGAGVDTLIGVESVVGTSSADTLIGDDNANTLNGSNGDDVLDGQGGIDNLFGGNGNDQMLGGEGNDFFRGAAGNDTANGGNGQDRVSMFGAASGVTVDLNIQGVAQDTVSQGMDTLISIEDASGSIHNDTLIGNSGDNWLWGNSGIDTLTGGGGNDLLWGDGNRTFLPDGTPVHLVFSDVLSGGDGIDTVSYFDNNARLAGVTVNLALGTGGDVGAGESDSLSGIENVEGSNFADNITGDANVNVLSGLAGDDILNGGLSSDVFAFLSLDDLSSVGDQITDFQSGSDTLDFSAIAGLTFIGTAAFSNVAGQMRYETGGGTTTILIDANGDGVADDRVVISNVEVALVETAPGSKILRTAGDIVGTANAETLTGTPGNDSIFGLGGDDTINALDLNDTADGGEGNDIVRGDGGDDTIIGGAGNDSLDGGAGTDTLTYANDAFRTQGMSFNFFGNTATSLTPGETDTFSNFEIVEGSNVNDFFGLSVAAPSVIRGMGGNDNFSGSEGIAGITLDGGADLDSYSQASVPTGSIIDLRLQGTAQTIGTSVVTLIGFENLNGGNFNDTLTGDDAANALNGNNGNDLLDGQGGIDNLFGGNGNDTMLGGEGNDFFRGAAGNDIADGGAGNDRVSMFGAATGATVDLNMQGVEQDTVSQGMDTLISIESVSGTIHADTFTGNALDNWLWGNSGIDTLSGGEGNDLFWGDGNSAFLPDGTPVQEVFSDIISGGDGIDTMSYFDNNARTSGVLVILASGTGGDNVAGESDSLSGIENVEGSMFADEISGDANANVLTGLNGNDLLQGGEGNDTLDGGEGNDTISGDAGSDTLIGGAGIDTLVHADAVTVNLATGTVTTMGGLEAAGVVDTISGIENVTLTPVSPNPGGITGDSNNNALNGAMFIDGAGGDDTIGGTGFNGAGQGDLLNGGTGNDTVLGFDGEDTLNGDEGDDTLHGGAGEDRLYGGIGNDVLNAGPGNSVGTGEDELYGDGGNDLLIASGDGCVLTGGTGADRFQFGPPTVLNATPVVTQVVMDASAAEGDSFEFSFSLAGYFLADGSTLDDGDTILTGAVLLGGGQASVMLIGFDVILDTDGNGVADLVLDNMAANPFATLTYNAANGAFSLA
jgi:Ca2+-binding RTX toxin-like protein